MATVNPTIDHAHRSVKVTWATAATGDTIVAAKGLRSYGAGGSVQAVGTWGAATVKLEGSNNGTTFQTLKQTPGGTDISMTADDHQPVGEMADDYRPAITGGTGDSLTITLLLAAS